MNLIEFPFGPITSTDEKTLEVEHEVWDRRLRRAVTRKLLITGSDAFGLPRPIDDQVLVGMKTLTHEARYASRRVEFSRYHLRRVLGWDDDGRAYSRLEESFDRIAGTTLKFKDAWWDKGEREWKSKTFHLIEEVDLCSRDQLDRTRTSTGRLSQQLCSFVWSDVIWKSFQDGFIKTLDMELFRKIAQGRRREVPLRLFRILDKRFHYGPVAHFDLRRLCVGTLGLCQRYKPSQMTRVLTRAAEWLMECDYLGEFWYAKEHGRQLAYFRRRNPAQKRRAPTRRSLESRTVPVAEDSLNAWLAQRRDEDLWALEGEALAGGFGNDLERRFVGGERESGVPIRQGGRIRREYVRRFVESNLSLTAAPGTK